MAARRIALARLIAALIALAFTLAGPVTAAQAMAGRMMASAATPQHAATDASPLGAALAAAPMPCHEGVAAEAVAVPMQHAAQPDGTTVRDGAPHGGGVSLAHLCCVLTCLMVPPLSVSHLASPLATPAALTARPALPMAGTSLARPDPPPRHA
ncbi:hypothetical protein J2X65_000947 [Ancylobacter sp. 3268]|uniref:hypothetical protein n=1 Tax=Ancylobacter sp. 3268 TaxID=2817752 RepID=UPI002857DFDF|nr:hypothetical protein [Ancylobacter sp. 3268]MDR6951598.1 hypothetical protein [Ancylobacter sp. 3268]